MQISDKQLKSLNDEEIKYIFSEIKDKELCNFIEGLLLLKTAKKQLLDNIIDKYGADYIYDKHAKHPISEHKEIVPTFTYVVEIFSDLVEHDTKEYQNFFGPNKKYIMAVWEEIKYMQLMKKEIEEKYGDKVKCILTDWNESIQFGCALYVYIL